MIRSQIHNHESSVVGAERKKKGQLWGTLQKVLEGQKALCVWGWRSEAWQPPRSQDTRPGQGESNMVTAAPHPGSGTVTRPTTTTTQAASLWIRVQTQSGGRCPPEAAPTTPRIHLNRSLC